MPAMRDPGVIDALDAAERHARAFDEISDVQDDSAPSFVRWVRLETRRRETRQRAEHSPMPAPSPPLSPRQDRAYHAATVSRSCRNRQVGQRNLTG